MRSMYKGLKSCVGTPEGLTDYFDCARGTRQGCMLSPMLFVLYISELIDMLSEEECIRVYVNEDAPNIILLLFADDIAMCSDMPGRLQHMLNVLKMFCDKWGLKLNLLKTKILVFRRGGIVKRNEKWFYGGKKKINVKKYINI